MTTEQTKAQAEKRAAKIEYRAHISREHAMTRGLAMGCAQVLRRGLVGRLKWLLLGK